MPSDKHRDDVNMVEFANRKMRRADGSTPLNLTAAELKERRSMRPGQVKFYNPDQVPEYNPTVIRKRQCPVCSYSVGRLFAVCLRCKTCMACGSYTTESTAEVCPTCGNYNSTPPPEPPSILVGA